MATTKYLDEEPEYISYKKHLYQIYSKIIISIIIYILQHFHYNPITIIAHTKYSLLYDFLLNKLNISFKIIMGSNKTILYNGKNYYDPNTNCINKLIKNNYDDIVFNLINEPIKLEKEITERMLKITKVVNKLYYVESSAGNWLSSIIISDEVEELKENDIIVGYNEKNEYKEIALYQNKCLIELCDDKCLYYGLKEKRFGDTLHPFNYDINVDMGLLMMTKLLEKLTG